MKKILSLALAVLMLVSALPVAYAAEGEHDYSNGTQITLVGTQESQGAQWTVTVPAKMVPGDTGTVTAEGTWAADQFINVHAPKTVTLTYGAQSMDIAVTFGETCGFSKIGNNAEAVSASADIAVAEANRLFGTWEGVIEYEVALIENGDVNRDGMITEADRDAIINSRLSPTQENYKELTEEQAQYADLSGDGTVDMTDAMMVNYIVQGWCEPGAVNAVQPVQTVMFYNVKYHCTDESYGTTDMMFTDTGDLWCYGATNPDGINNGTYTTDGQKLNFSGITLGTFSEDGYTFTTANDNKTFVYSP